MVAVPPLGTRKFEVWQGANHLLGKLISGRNQASLKYLTTLAIPGEAV
jgi:hypothetical protein